MKNLELGAAVAGSAAPQAWADELGQGVYAFALRVIELTDRLPEKRTASKVLSAQLVRSATSVAANYEEARGAVSYADFVFKMSLAYRECRESVLWLCLIRDAEIVPPSRMTAIITEGLELRAIFGTSVKTARQRRETK